MDVPIGDWGLYPWFEEDGVYHIHPDDLEAIRQLGPYCRVFRVVANDVEYVSLRYADRVYRVRPNLFQRVTGAPRPFGEAVHVRKGDGIIAATISDIMWHYKREAPFYYLTADGKRLKKRYWQEDFLNPDGLNQPE